MTEEIIIAFDPSKDKVLGVFGNAVHIDNREGVIITSIDEYLRVWKNWLIGKKEYCERYNHYCGVMGYVSPVSIEEKDTKIQVVEWDDEKEEQITIDKRVFLVKRFEDEPDFEHG